jgi:hypothetical protein
MLSVCALCDVRVCAGVYEGQRIRDGARGWFPAATTQEIVGKHAKARNLRMLFRFQKIMLNEDPAAALPAL